MIQLHVLGRSDDGTQLLLAAHPEAAAAGYCIAIDGALLDFLEQANSLGEDVEEPSGEDVAELDAESEPEFQLPEGPIDVDSPAAALEAAHGLWLVREDDSGLEVSDSTLHEAVLFNLHKWNVRLPRDIIDEGWWVTKLGDKAWQISFRFLSRGRIHEAEWVLDTDIARLVPENQLAILLGWWKSDSQQRPRRRRRGGRGRGRARAKTPAKRR